MTLLGGQITQPQIDPWRQQLQQLHASGAFGSNNGTQAYSGPSSQMAYAMSGQGKYLNQPTQTPTPQQDTGGGLLGGGGGGGLAEMIRQLLAQQQQGSIGSGGQVTLPRQPAGPSTMGGNMFTGGY